MQAFRVSGTFAVFRYAKMVAGSQMVVSGGWVVTKVLLGRAQILDMLR